MSKNTFAWQTSIFDRVSPSWLGGIIVLFVLAAYFPALHGGFIWDDDFYVTNNWTLHDFNGLKHIWFDTQATPQYYPLVHTTFWMEYHVWNLNPMGYHAVNVLLHALGAILFWRVLKRLDLPGAWLAAAVFALHPVNVESVVWITERKNVLSAVWFFGAAWAYLNFLGESETKNKRVWWSAALLLFICAMLSKTVACSLPPALLLICLWKKKKMDLADVLPTIPFFIVGLWLGLQTAWLEKHHVGASGVEWSLSFLDRCLIAGRALWFYAGKLVWPTQLTFVYPRWQIDAGIWWQWLFPAAVLATLAALWFARKLIGRGPLVAVLFFSGALFPALGFINVYPMRYSFVADHFQYAASIGLIALVAAGITLLFKTRPLLELIFCGALLLTLGTLTWRQAGTYRNMETLWRTTLARNSGAWMAYQNLGCWLEQQGRIDEAIENYQKAIKIKPDCYEVLNNLGVALDAKGLFDEAVKNYRQAIKINPNYSDALNNLGVSLTAKGRYNDAINSFLKAIQINPAYSGALNNLAWLLAASPDPATRNGSVAIRLAERACELTDHTNPFFIGTLADAYAEAGRFPEAITNAIKAAQLADKSGLTSVAVKNRQLIELYLAKKAYHEPPPPLKP